MSCKMRTPVMHYLFLIYTIPLDGPIEESWIGHEEYWCWYVPLCQKEMANSLLKKL